MPDYQYVSCDHAEIRSLRELYIDSLAFPIELYIEWRIKDGYSFKIYLNTDLIGYFILDKENSLIEFYLLPLHQSKCCDIFNDISKNKELESVTVLSFDSMTLKCCLENNYPYKILGKLFRDYLTTQPEDVSRFTKRIVTTDDYAELLGYEDELYESEAELAYMINNKIMHLYYLRDKLVGCGYLIKIIEHKSWHDIGMWVHKPYRKQGIGTKIISDLKNHCLLNNFIPTCGCAADNIASQKTLEKNGFITKHHLLQFKCYGLPCQPDNPHPATRSNH